MERKAFSFGKRFHYSEYTVNNTDIDMINGGISKDWFVITKYDSLKEEMLINNIYCMSADEWMFNYQRATQIIQCRKAKSCSKTHSQRWKTFYGSTTEPTNLITIEHIVCMSIYCNFFEICEQFLNTYKRLMNESNMNNSSIEYETIKMWKERHSEYAIFGRLLRNIIEDWGTTVPDRNQSMQFYYHGIQSENDSPFVFNSTLLRFCSPMSTSIHSQVVHQYLNHSSSVIMIELKQYSKYLRYFHPFWMSDHSNEYEHIFCGGDWPLKLNSVFDVFGHKHSFNYQYYIRAINVLQDLFRGDYNHECEYIHDKIECAIQLIISARLCMTDELPIYVDLMFDAYCENLGNMIEINMAYMDIECEGYLRIKSAFFTIDENIKIDVLCSLFPKMHSFKFISYHLQWSVFDCILLFLQTTAIKNYYRISNLIFCQPNESELRCKQVMKKYKSALHRISWSIKYKKKDAFGQPVLIITRLKEVMYYLLFIKHYSFIFYVLFIIE